MHSSLVLSVIAATLLLVALAFARMWLATRARLADADAAVHELRAIVETAPDAIFLVNDQGQIEMLNEQAEQLFGYQRDELIGTSVDQLIPQQRRSRHARHRAGYLAAPTARAMGIGLDLEAERADGTVFAVDVKLSVVALPNRTMTAAAVRDISWHRQIEEDLRTAKQLAERAADVRTRFLAAASHDLRQPLQSLTMYHSVLSKVSDAERDATITRMGLALESMGSLLDALLDVSRFDADSVHAEFQEVPVVPLLERALAQVADSAERKGLTLRLDAQAKLIWSDPALLTRILENLLGNAVRYTDSGSVSIRTRIVDAGDFLSIDVIDTGIGIPAEALTDIFSEYTQLHNQQRDRDQGLGLGLAVVQRISRLLEHPVTVLSEPGLGSEFSVRVPARGDAPAEQDTRDVDEAAPNDAIGKILLIDDDADVLFATDLLLSASGYEVVTCADGASALAALDGGLIPDLIVSDYRLPAGVTGPQLIGAARQRLGVQTAAIVLTGDTTLATDADTLGDIRVVYKPFDGEALLSLIGELSSTKPGGVHS